MKPISRLLGAIAALLVAFAAQAQDYPTKPIQLITPFSPGGTTDLVARIIAEKMTANWGQTVVVDNRTGANGMIGTEVASRAAPDGHTLVIVISNHVLYKYVTAKVPFDPLKDFEPVIHIARMPSVGVLHPSVPVPANDMKAFLAYAREKGPISFGHGGIGHSAHLVMLMFSQMSRIPFEHVPYKGGGPAIADVVAGHLPMTAAAVATVSARLREGKVKPVFVTSAQRQASIPDTPTLVESGFPGLVANEWWGILAPAGTPRGIVDKINAEVVRIFNLPDVKERIAKVDMEYVGSTPDAFRTYLQDESEKWGKVLTDAGVKPE